MMLAHQLDFETAEKEMEVEEVKRVLAEKQIIPLQTMQSMADRWGVSRQNVAMRATRHEHFPKPLEGIVEATMKTTRLFPLYEVVRYEQEERMLR